MSSHPEENSQPETAITFDPVDLARWDPVLRWMLKSSRGVVMWGFALSLVFNIVRGAAAWADGHFISHGQVVGFANDYSVYSNFIFGWVIFSYYVWMPRGIAQVFNGLVHNGVFCQGPDDDLPVVASEKDLIPGTAGHLAAARDSFRSPWLCVIAGVTFLVVFFLLGNQYGKMGEGIWYTAGTLSQITAQAWGAVLISVLAVLIYGSANVIRHLRLIFAKLSLGLRPAHVDGVGGLSPLGQFAVRLVYVISIVGVMLLAITPYTRGLATHHELQYTLSPELVAAGVVYFFLSPLLFFLVLGTASAAMRDTKNKVMSIVCERIDKEYATVLCTARDIESTELKNHVDNLEAAQRLYKTTQEFPVWPFDGSSIRKFTASYVAPLGTGLLMEVVLRLVKMSE